MTSDNSKSEVSVSDCIFGNGEFSFNINTYNYTGKSDETMKVVVAYYDSERTLLSVTLFDDTTIDPGINTDRKSENVPVGWAV